MKLTPLASIAAVAAAALAYSAKAQVSSFPLVNLTISGTVSYNSNSPSDNGTTKKSALTTVKFTTKSLIGLLNASPAVTNTLRHVTGTNQIPAGSYFLFDLYNENLIVTNKNGFSFTLDGGGTNYDYGDLFVGGNTYTKIIGSYSQNDTTGAGSESDLAVIELYFNDGNGNSLDDYGNGSLKWSFGSVSGGVQKTTLSVNFPATEGDNDTVNYYTAIAQNVKCSGKATANVESGVFPFYLWWPIP
jgi:hypothetical protein